MTRKHPAMHPWKSARVVPCAALLAALSACADPPQGEDTDAGSGTSGATTDAPTTSATGGPEPAQVTWHEHIAPIVVGKCSSCHRDGGIAPFALSTYADAQPWAESALDSVVRGSMPPFLADETAECTPRHGWVDDMRLADAELDLLEAWVAQGAPEGDPAKAAPLPAPPELELSDADLEVQITAPVTIDGTSDQFLCFSIDPGLAEDTWIDALQIHAGNEKIVHHVLAYVDETGASADLANADGYYPCFGDAGVDNAQLIAAWAPGMTPFRTPPDVAARIVAGSRIILNIHYHPTGTPEVDASTSLAMRTRPTIPPYVAFIALPGNEDGADLLPGPNDEGGKQFKIPAGAVDHTEEMLLTLDDLPELKIFAAGTHMHYVGTDMLIELRRPNPDPGEPASECLIQTPRWNFQWQRTYSYAADLADVPVAEIGDQVYLRCTYNNSMSNPFVVQALAEQGLGAPVDVYLGEETLDEMCLGVIGVAVALKDVI
mgnify:CR=1 FL=1